MIFLSLKNGKEVTNREKSSVASCPSRFFLKISNIIKSYAMSVTTYYWCYGIWGKNGRKERIQKTNLHIYVNLIYGRGGIVEYWRKEMLLNKCFGKLSIHVKRKKKDSGSLISHKEINFRRIKHLNVTVKTSKYTETICWMYKWFMAYLEMYHWMKSLITLTDCSAC